MTRDQTIADCLRCSASSKPTRDCIGCPYDIKEELPELFAGHPELLEVDGYCHSCDVDRMANDAADAIERLLLAEKTSNKERENMEWISVAERLPQRFVSVLVHMPGEKPHPTVHEGFLVEGGKWYAAHFTREADEITHWMPLPAPPEEVEE